MRSFMIRQARVSLALVLPALLLLLSAPAAAQSCPGTAAVIGSDDDASSLFGNTASIRTVYPQEVSIGIVRSIYAWYSANNWIEIGWEWELYYDGDTEPELFIAWTKGGVYGEHDYPSVDFGGAGSYNLYRLTRQDYVSGSGYPWWGRLNGTFVGQVTFPDMWSGANLAGSERDDYCTDSNWGHFRSLQRIVTPGQGWSNWADLYKYHDSDDDYGLREISNYEFYVEEGY